MTVAKAIMILARSAAEAAAMAAKYAITVVQESDETAFVFSDGSSLICDGPRYFAG